MNTPRTLLSGPFHPYGKYGWIGRACAGGDDLAVPFQSRLCLFEDGRRLSNGHVPHRLIGDFGGGRFSHWNNDIYFSASDGSDPNTNGRVYSFDLSLNTETWNRERLARSAKRWDWHPRAAYFRERGGDVVPPPFLCNIGLTNKCNLRCEICGSQKHLDEAGVRRRHMQFKTFEAVAETIFPFLSIVELNSQGDPLLHPNIADVLARIAHHGCDIKVQHNGTLLSDRVIDLLFQQHGTIMLSLDAVGEKFDEVRRGGVWSKALPGLTRLFAERDPTRLSIGVYPTLTRRTIGEALRVVEWCAEQGADVVAFHRYAPVNGSFEEAPADDEYNEVKDRLRQWCAQYGDPMRVLFESEGLNSELPSSPRTRFASDEKAAIAAEFYFPIFPTEDDSSQADPILTCTAPRDYVEIGLEGQINACCRSQYLPLGYATSVEEFCDSWLASNYDRIRDSLTRGATGPYPLPNCEGCMTFFAPRAAGARKSVNYSSVETWPRDGLSFSTMNEIRIEEVGKERGYCFIATLPPLENIGEFQLWEDNRPLGPGGTLHDDIRSLGRGRYHLSDQRVYFSSSDGSDVQRNQRTYLLRRGTAARDRIAV